MKHFLLIAILISTFSGAVYAEQVETADCQQMAESNDRISEEPVTIKTLDIKSNGSTKQ